MVPGQHEVLLDGQQQLPPGPPPVLGADLERADAQRGPAAGVLRELLLPGGQAPADQAAALQPDAHEQERDREGVGQVLEVVGDVPAVAAAGIEEVDIVHFTDRRESQMASDLRYYVAYMFAAERLGHFRRMPIQGLVPRSGRRNRDRKSTRLNSSH